MGSWRYCTCRVNHWQFCLATVYIWMALLLVEGNSSNHSCAKRKWSHVLNHCWINCAGGHSHHRVTKRVCKTCWLFGFCTNIWIKPLHGVLIKRDWAFVTRCADTSDLGANLWVLDTSIGASLSEPHTCMTALDMRVCICACLFGLTTYRKFQMSTFKYLMIECPRMPTCTSAKLWNGHKGPLSDCRVGLKESKSKYDSS